MGRTRHFSDGSGCQDSGYCSDAPSRIIIGILVQVSPPQEGGACEVGISAARADALRIAKRDYPSLAEARDEIGVHAWRRKQARQLKCLPAA